jgi:outer membrane lipoprotein-sorting protein
MKALNITIMHDRRNAMRRMSIFVLALMGALVLAACGNQLPTAEEIVEQMEAARETTNEIHALVAIDFETTEESGNMLVEVWMQKTDEVDAAGDPINRMRAELREISAAGMADATDLTGSLAVSDGESFWLYNPSKNVVITGTAAEMKDQPLAGETGNTEMLQDLIQQGLDAVDLEVLGEEQVAGKNTWKVRVTPASETSDQLQLDAVIEGIMWVDEELALPLKLDVDASDFGRGTVEVREIEVNSGLNADLFTFEIPEGAEVVQAADLVKDMKPQPVTLEEARNSVSFSLLEPTVLPEGMTLVEVNVLGTTTVILNYAGADQSLSLVQSNEDVGDDREPPVGSEVQEVTVRGQPATLIVGADGKGSLLRWEENGIKLIIAGTIDGDTAIEVAEGLQ